MQKRIVAIIQARMSSSRLPGKVMLPLCDRPVLLHVVERTARAELVDQVVVATSSDVSDDIIEDFCASSQVACFRGSLDNVLDRFIQAGRATHATHIVRISADSPLMDACAINDVVNAFGDGVDYVSNVLNRTLPRGLCNEMVSLAVLEEIAQLDLLPHHKEHVTPFVYEHPERYKLVGVESPDERLAHPEWRWCVDELADYKLIKQVFEALYPRRADFDSYDVAALLAEHPELIKINSGIAQKQTNPLSLATAASSGKNVKH